MARRRKLTKLAVNPDMTLQDPRERVLEAIKYFCTEPDDIYKAMQDAGIDMSELLKAIENPNTFKAVERNIERAAHTIYLLACVKLAHTCLEAEAPNTKALEFLAKRFDERFMPQAAVLHQHQSLPEFADMSTGQFLDFVKVKVPPWMMQVVRGEQRTDTGAVIKNDLEDPREDAKRKLQRQ